jgi:hypothetical protein
MKKCQRNIPTPTAHQYSRHSSTLSKAVHTVRGATRQAPEFHAPRKLNSIVIHHISYNITRTIFHTNYFKLLQTTIDTATNIQIAKQEEPPQGPTFVGTGSGAPEVPELPSARGYNWATRPQGDINSGDWPSRMGVGSKASDLTLENLIAMKSQTRVTC